MTSTPAPIGGLGEFSHESYESAGVKASLLEYLHACPICLGRRLDHYCRVPSLFVRDQFIRYERCRGCGTVLRNPRLPTEYRQSRYEDKVFSDREKQPVAKNQLHYRHVLNTLERLLPDPNRRRLLDFGCGSGGLLLEARAAGFQVEGLELCRDLARHVEKTHDIPVFQGLLDDPAFTEHRFDIVASSQVFEHLVDPLGTLETLTHLLDRPGLLLIEVPNLRHFRERLRRGSFMDDSHLFYFSASSLSGLLEAQGFRVLRVEEGVRPYGVAFRLGLPTPPPWVSGLGERLSSSLQLKTGLSIVARIDRP